MKFVTKEEFEKAIITLELALQNGQVRYGRYDDTVEMNTLLFSVDSMDSVPADHACFISPLVAAKNRLASIRNKLSKQKEMASQNSRLLEELGKKEQELALLVPILKE
jgi:hypothetical protein